MSSHPFHSQCRRVSSTQCRPTHCRSRTPLHWRVAAAAPTREGRGVGSSGRLPREAAAGGASRVASARWTSPTQKARAFMETICCRADGQCRRMRALMAPHLPPARRRRPTTHAKGRAIGPGPSISCPPQAACSWPRAKDLSHGRGRRCRAGHTSDLGIEIDLDQSRGGRPWPPSSPSPAKLPPRGWLPTF